VIHLIQVFAPAHAVTAVPIEKIPPGNFILGEKVRFGRFFWEPWAMFFVDDYVNSRVMINIAVIFLCGATLFHFLTVV